MPHTNEGTVAQKSGLLDLCAQRNSHSFIFCLPTEILESIFIDCARDHYSKENNVLSKSAPSWVNVSYVCRHWRNVALDCPTLWSYLFATSLRWTEELLARSKQAPLKLYIIQDLTSPFSLELCFVEPVMKHIERIQELHLCVQDECSVTGYFSRFSSPAPLLETLSITTERRSSEWSSILFNGNTPALRTLELSRCPVPWYSFKLGSLTTLSLHRIPVRFQQNMEALLATLSCMENLIHLNLDSALGSAVDFFSSAAFRAFQKINLPRLSLLCIVAPLSTVIALLSCVNIPLKAAVTLECYSERGTSVDHYALFASLLAQRLGALADQTPSTSAVRSLVIETTSSSATFMFSVAERDFASSVFRVYMNWDRNVPLQVFIPFNRPITQNDRESIICDICCSLPLTNVQSLHIIPPQFSSSSWRKILGHLQDLRYLKLSQGDMPLEDLASILSPTPSCYTQNEDVRADRDLDWVLAPALEELELYKLKCMPKSPPKRDMDALVTSVQSLYDALSSRKESRGQLTMAQCVARYDKDSLSLDMVGKWEGGQFHVVEDRIRRWTTP